MSRYRSFAWVLAVSSSLLSSFCGAAEAKIGTQARWGTYATESEASYFALSLRADLKSFVSTMAPPQVALIVDTSASQTGKARIDSIAVAKAIIEALPSDAKVALAACDVETHDLSQGLRNPRSDELKAAMKSLENRLPLGATDLEAALRSGGRMVGGQANASIIYIGDGIARSHVLNREEFKTLVSQLVEDRVSVNSIAIGPFYNVEGLATLANHTGGRYFVWANSQVSTQEFGKALAQASMQPVFWVQEGVMPSTIDSYFPKAIPPLRADRDSILIGTESLPSDEQVSQVVLKGVIAGQQQSIEWTITKEPSNFDFAFLPKVVGKAKVDDGLYLPTAGSEALRGLSLQLNEEAGRLVESGRFALQGGDLIGALRIAEEALASDPNNLEARDLRDTIRQRQEAVALPKKAKLIQAPLNDPLGSGVVVPEAVQSAPESLPPMVESAPLGEVPSFPTPSAFPPTPGYSIPSTDGLSELATAGDLLSKEDGLRRIKAEQFETSARVRIREAEAALSRDPIGAEGALKLLLSDIRRSPELEPGVRARLEAIVRSNIESASRKVALYREQASRAEEVASNASATERILSEVERSEASVQQLVERFNALMSQQLFSEANTEIAPVINETLPNTVIAKLVENESSMAANYQLNEQVVYAKRRGFLDNMFAAEKQSIPFSEEPPIVYPPADVWRALSARRLERFGSIDIASGTSPNEKRIYDALKTNYRPDFNATPLRSVVETLSSEKNIPIVLDTTALEGGAATPEDPITLTGIPEISLRSALRLILDPLELTYVIEDEVMKITTKDVGSARVLRIYPVGDLVIPVISGLGGGGGMMGGMGGGGMGGGGMGGGGMGGMGGGGMGGGGMGGGGFGGGGNFAVPDEPSKNETQEKPLAGETPVVKPVVSTMSAANQLIDKILSQSDEKKRAALEQELTVLVSDELAAAKRLLASDKIDEIKPRFQAIIDVVGDALRKGAPQPWMYEALSLSMQVCNYPATDIRRVLLSSVDFSGDVEDAIKVGRYLAKQGMSQEALSVLRDAARSQPLRSDIYEIALPLAIKTENSEALVWTCLGVLSQAWPEEQAKLVETAELAAKGALIRMISQGRVMEAKIMEDAVKTALKRDLVVRISWTGKADLDVSVEEPSGTVCSLSNPRTPSGGVLLNDGNSNTQNLLEEYSETYACPVGYSGEYQILIEKIWGEVAGGKVTVDILSDFGTPSQTYRREQIPIDEKDALVKIAVKNGHRETPMADIAIAKSDAQKLAAGRAVLAQQLQGSDIGSGNNALASLLGLSGAGNGSGNGTNNPFLNPFRGAVGYRPIITVLPQGTQFLTNAVISGDRRYVRITPFPFFTDIVQVDTFNFIDGTGTTQGGGLTGGGGGGGGFGGGGNF